MAYLSMPWGKMFYSDAGTGELPLVFLHGSGCDSDDWAAVLRALPATIRVVRMDFRVHGRSHAPALPFTIDDLADDVLSLANHLGINRAVLVGHSLGGMVAMGLAARSSLPAGLVLLEGWTNLRAARHAFAGERFYGRLDPSSVLAIQRKNQATQKRTDPLAWALFWDSVQSLDSLPFLRTAAIPIIEAYGEMGRTETTQKLLMIPGNPRIQLAWIANAGHYLPHEKPDDVAALCREAAKKCLSVSNPA